MDIDPEFRNLGARGWWEPARDSPPTRSWLDAVSSLILHEARYHSGPIRAESSDATRFNPPLPPPPPPLPFQSCSVVESVER